jgi:hypothetical protein
VPPTTPFLQFNNKTYKRQKKQDPNSHTDTLSTATANPPPLPNPPIAT